MRRGNWRKRGSVVLVAGMIAGTCMATPAGAEPPEPAGAAASRDESPELATDRPDFTETAVVVPRGSLQLESGFTWASQPGGRSFNAPEALLRAGLLSRTELRLELPGYFRLRGTESASGLSDAAVGFKHQLGPTRTGFELALISMASLPVGADTLTSGAPDPAIALAWARDLAPGWSLGGIFEFSWPTEPDGRNRTAFATLAVGRELSDAWGAFLEYAGELPERGGDGHLLHHGYTYAPSTQTQLDLHFGVGLTAAAPCFFIGAGYSVRYGPRRRAAAGRLPPSRSGSGASHSKPARQPL